MLEVLQNRGMNITASGARRPIELPRKTITLCGNIDIVLDPSLHMTQLRVARRVPCAVCRVPCAVFYLVAD